ncbi:MAG TPA: glycosyltransferase family 39 protein [Anaerolineae bacterium]|nr:glycosyltransferase family 39 protein [Anaerolineae bacterium]
MKRNSNVKQLLVALGLFLLALGPRSFGLGVFITADERRWIERSVQFFSALLAGDFAHTFQTGHPGVTTKWTGTVGLLAKYLIGATVPSQARQPSLAGLRAFLEAVPVRPSVSVEYLPAMRFPTVLLTAACVVAVYFMVRRIFGHRVALLSGVLLALDPFYLSHSRVIHHDALATTFMTLAVLSFLICAWHGRWRTFLVFSGLAAGLSFLSKGPALFLAPFVGLLCVMGYLAQVENWRKIEREALVRWGSAWLGWAAVTLLIFFLLWPVTWIEPVSAIQGLLAKAIGYAGEAHTKGNFFLGRVVDDPGPLFYPVTLLFRTTPLTLLGLAAAFCFWLKGQRTFAPDEAKESSYWQRFIGLLLGKGEERETRSRKLSLLSLWAYLFSFVLFMTLGDKKFDRYILPIYPMVEILAALGLCQLGALVAKRIGERYRDTMLSGRSVWVFGLAVATILQAEFTLPHHPYYLTYYNPLVGGSWLAPKTYYVGWGEGLDLMARYLNQKPGAAQLKVSSWYHRELIPFFIGSADRLDAKGDTNLMPWHTADYVVFYLNQVQRENPSPALVNYIRSLEPEHVVHLKGIDYAWLYRTPEYIPDEVVPAQHVQRAWFGDDLALLGYDVDSSLVPPDEPGTLPFGKVRVNLYWEARREMEADYRIFLDLINGVYHVWGKQDGRPYRDSYPTNQWPRGLVLRDVREIEVWPGTPPGYYQIAVSVYDPASGRWLSPAGGGDVLIGPVELPRREPPPVGALDIEHPLSANLDGKVRLLGYNVTGAFRPGKDVHLTLFWQALKAMDEDYTVFIHLADSQGHLWGQKDNPPVDGFYPTTAWQAGEIVRDQYDLGVSPDAPPGPYQLEVGMYLAETGKRLPVLAEDGSVQGDKILLTRVEVE